MNIQIEKIITPSPRRKSGPSVFSQNKDTRFRLETSRNDGRAILLGLLIGFLSLAPLHADTGKTGAVFLSLGNGARAAGMGEAQTGLAEGTNALYWNPAGLGLTAYPEISLSQLQHFEDSTFQYAGLVLPLQGGQKGALGFSVSRLAIEEIESRDAGNALLGTVKQEDLSIQVSYGRRIWGSKLGPLREGLFLGVGAKRISEELAGVKSDTVAGDVGIQYRPGLSASRKWGQWVRRTTVGMAATNWGGTLKFDREETDLPQETKVGIGYTHFIFGDALNLGVDYRLIKEEDPRISTGAEFWLKNMLAFRLGYITGQDVGEGIRAGMGFRFKLIQFDYAWAGFGDALDNTHRFSFLLRFGKGAPSLQEGLQEDLIQFYLDEAQGALKAGSHYEAVLNANRVLEIDSRNPQALQILFEAGEKLKTPGPIPIDKEGGGQ